MIKGIIAGNFDVIHPGYIAMFEEMKQHCSCLIVLLHTDPSIERPHKIKPILHHEERKKILNSIKYVDDVIRYTYEEQLYDLLKVGEFDIRFLGDDYRGKTYTGFELNTPVHYLNRDHGWSTTKFKKLIHDGVKKQMG